MNTNLLDHLRGVAVGPTVGDALGMPLEFGPAVPPDRLVRTMQAGRLAAGAFTDDTEMALALAGAAYGLNAISLARRAAVHGQWPLRGGQRWDVARLVALADRLAGTPAAT